ncbi:S8 family peptidase [bacterium]|nr:S8 family peptidase [bacterium]
MFTKKIIILLITTLIFPGSHNLLAGRISPSLLSQIDNIDENREISVILSLKPSIEYKKISGEIREFPMPERRTEGRKVLKHFWDEEYRDIHEFLIAEYKKGNVSSVRNLWIGNGLAFSGKASVIRQLVNDDRIQHLFEDKLCFMLHDFRPPSFEEMAPDATLSPLETAWGVTRIGAPSVWSSYNGSNVVVGVLDTGVNYYHNDLENNIWENADEIPGNGEDDDFNGYVDDYYGYNFADGDPDPLDDGTSYHGTHTSGTVAGDGTSGTNTGVAPGAKIMALKVLFSSGSGWPSDVVEAMQYGVDNGAHVFSLSIGFERGSYDTYEDYTIVRDYFRGVFENVLTIGITAAVAAGNGADGGYHYYAPEDIIIPADSPAPWEPPNGHSAAMAVGNTNSSDNINYSSSFGPSEWNDDEYSDYPYGVGGGSGLMKPDVSAPGTNIKSCWGGSETGYTTYSGTSMSAPHLAGMIALMLDKNPTLTPEEIDSIIETTALDLGISGKDSLYGSGLIRAVPAILNTPELTIPFIYHQYHDVDPTGNNVFDVNETIDLIVTLDNLGYDATGVSVTLSESSPYISLPDPTATFGSISSGSTGNNSTNPFRVHSAPDTPLGHLCELFMNISADGGYSNTDTFEISVGTYPRDYLDHNIGNLVFSVTNFGGYGYFDPTMPTPSGSGFDYNGYNYLYSAGFLMGLNYNNVITHEYGQTSEWLPTSELVFTDPPEADELITTSFIDPGTGIKITQRSYAWATEDFILIKYDLRNTSMTTVSNFYTALYADWDIHYASSAWYDQGSYSSTNNWGYMYDTDSPPEAPAYVGLVGLSPLARGSMVENAVYVYPTDGGMGWDDTVKYNFMDGTFSDNSGSPDDDWSMIIVSGPFTLPPAAHERIGYAIVAGDNLLDFQSNAGAARTRWSAVNVEQQPVSIPEKTRLFNCFPNPFNGITTISYYIEETGKVNFTFYDITGKTIETKTLTHGEPGKYSFVFNADELPSGVYFYTMKTREKVITKSMILIK